MCTDAVTFLFSTHNYWAMNYLEDFIGALLRDVKSDAFITLKILLESISLSIDKKKVQAQTHKMHVLTLTLIQSKVTLAIPCRAVEKKIMNTMATQAKG